jgi:hypothetical protein
LDLNLPEVILNSKVLKKDGGWLNKSSSNFRPRV